MQSYLETDLVKQSYKVRFKNLHSYHFLYFMYLMDVGNTKDNFNNNKKQSASLYYSLENIQLNKKLIYYMHKFFFLEY